MKIQIPRHILDKCGKFLVKAVQEEVLKDIHARVPHNKQGLPSSREFLDSFSYKIRGKGIELLCDWPWIERHTEGREPFRMKWLLSEPGSPKIIPIRTSSGEIAFRTAPLRLENAWVHPGVAKFNFIERAKERMLDKMVELIQEDLPQLLEKNFSL